MRFDSLDDWLEWQARQHPRSVDLGLERVGTVWSRLSDADPPWKLVTVAGTNGKGSCVAMLESILQRHGYRVGSYTSPHLVRYNERIRIKGIQAEDQELCRAFDLIDKARADISLTYFEFGTLAALYLFNRTPLDLVILEVGLGGRLDAVNILDPDVALITTVDVDHTEWLGSERELIAREKAGIIRPGRPVVFGHPDLPESIGALAKQIDAPLFSYGRDYRAEPGSDSWSWIGPDRRFSDLPNPSLRGSFQLRNAAAVLMVLECLKAEYPVDPDAICDGLRYTDLKGRYQVLAGEVILVLDVAHNVQAAETLAENLEESPCPGQTFAVFAMLADKDVYGVARAVDPSIDRWFLAGLDGDRGQSAESLRDALTAAGIRTPKVGHATVSAALDQALQVAGRGDRVLVFGSFHTVGQAFTYLEGCQSTA